MVAQSGGKGRQTSEFKASLVYKSKFQASQGYSDVLTQYKPKIKPTLISKLIKKYTEGLDKLGDIVEVVVAGTVGL